MVGMFAKAKKIETAPKAKGKAAKVQIGIEGMMDLASIDAMIKALTALKETVEADVKSQMCAEFVKMGVKQKSRPANFQGVEGNATASCELRKRASTSPLTAEEIETLSAVNIPVEPVEIIKECFVINPAYMNDQVILGKVEKALAKVTDLPEDFIMMQEGKSKTVVADAALDKLFTLNAETAAKLLPLVAVPSIKPKLDGEDAILQAYDHVKKLLGFESEDEEAEAA